jgi:hypothetical protein
MGEFRETRRTAAEIGRVRGRRPDHRVLAQLPRSAD